MYDVNPQGPLMHLKELERQAGLISRKRTKKDHPGRPVMLRLWLAAALQWRRHPVARRVSAE